MLQSGNNIISNDTSNDLHSSDSESEIIINDDCIPDEAEINKQLFLFRQELEAQAQIAQNENSNALHDEGSEPIIVLREIAKLHTYEEIQEGDVIIDDIFQTVNPEESKCASNTAEKGNNDDVNNHITTSKQNNDKVLVLSTLAQNNAGVHTLLTAQLKNPAIDLSPSIVALIKKMEYYSDISDDAIKEEINAYIRNNKHSFVDSTNNNNSSNNNNELSAIQEEQVASHKKVFERLYEQRKRFKIEMREHKSRCSSVNLSVSTKNRLEKLYSDYKKPKMVTTQNITETPIKSNDKSIMILFNKFVTQFNKSITSLYSPNIDIKSEDIYLTLNQLKILLNSDNLCFVNEYSSGTNSKQEELLYKVYYLLKVGNKLSLQNFFLFALSILNFQSCLNEKTKAQILIYPKSTSSLLTSANTTSTASNNSNVLLPCMYFSVLPKNKIHISKEQSHRIFKDFQVFNSNWKSSLAEKTKKKVTMEIQLPTFKPETNTKYNNKKVKGNLFTHSHQFKLRQSFEKLSSTFKENEEEMCTFKPLVNKKSVHSSIKSKYKETNSSAGLLKYNKSKDEIEYEQNKSEYTFKPNLTLSNCNTSTNNKLSVQDKAMSMSLCGNHERCLTSYEEKAYLERMKKGRGESERVKQAKLFRSSASLNKTKSSTGIAMRRRPALIIDIEMFGDNKRIFIYKNDNPALVSERFINEHKIKDKKLIEQIKEMVYEEMKTIK